MKLRVGIAGYGVVGRRRRAIIDQHPRLETVAVCDQRFEQDGLAADDVRCFTRFESLLREPLDVLFVCMPNYLAAEVTAAGLERGAHVFCEKPPATTIADLKSVMDVERNRPGQILKYGFNHRHHGSVREALRLVASGEYGDVLNIRGVYGKSKIIPFSGGWRAERAQAGGGILLDQGVHMLDLMRLFCGEFTDVRSFVSNAFWKHDVEDNAFALLRDDRGRVAMLHSSATQWQHRFVMEIAMAEGYLELRGILSGSTSYGQERLVVGRRDDADTGSASESVITFLEDHSWADDIAEFVDAIDGVRPLIHGKSEDALAVMRLVFQIYWEDADWRQRYQIDDSFRKTTATKGRDG